jgi:hypothetical protein
LTVDVPGTPAIYLLPAGMPPGWEVIGTVTGADGPGALVRNTHTGVYCKANAGAIRSLPQRKVIAALAGAEDGA